MHEKTLLMMVFITSLTTKSQLLGHRSHYWLIVNLTLILQSSYNIIITVQVRMKKMYPRAVFTLKMLKLPPLVFIVGLEALQCKLMA